MGIWGMLTKRMPKTYSSSKVMFVEYSYYMSLHFLFYLLNYIIIIFNMEKEKSDAIVTTVMGEKFSKFYDKFFKESQIKFSDKIKTDFFRH